MKQVQDVVLSNTKTIGGSLEATVLQAAESLALRYFEKQCKAMKSKKRY